MGVLTLQHYSKKNAIQTHQLDRKQHLPFVAVEAACLDTVVQFLFPALHHRSPLQCAVVVPFFAPSLTTTMSFCSLPCTIAHDYNVFSFPAFHHRSPLQCLFLWRSLSNILNIFGRHTTPSWRLRQGLKESTFLTAVTQVKISPFSPECSPLNRIFNSTFPKLNGFLLSTFRFAFVLCSVIKVWRTLLLCMVHFFSTLKVLPLCQYFHPLPLCSPGVYVVVYLNILRFLLTRMAV